MDAAIALATHTAGSRDRARGGDESSGRSHERAAAHPRTGFKTGIVEAFSAGMRDKPETAFGTMNTDILQATVPGYVRPNFCDYIRDSRFDT